MLTDFPAYVDWNPHIRKVLGEPAVGRRITVHSQPPDGRTVVLRPLVVRWSPPYELRWRATFISRRLFSSEHGFRLEQGNGDRARFVQDEKVSGLLVPLYARLRLPATRHGFEQVNQALRERAEKMAAGA